MDVPATQCAGQGEMCLQQQLTCSGLSSHDSMTPAGQRFQLQLCDHSTGEHVRMTHPHLLGVPVLLAACNAEIRSTLGDKRLQDLLLKIDGAANREQVGCAHLQVA